MISIQSLFDVTDSEEKGVHKKHKKRMNRKCKYIKNYEHLLPNIQHPTPGSEDFKIDLDDVKFYYSNSSLSTNFLDFSNKSVQGCFETLCEEIDLKPDWRQISKILDDVDTIVLRLKYDHCRPRPKYFLIEQSSLYNAIKDNKSPSFPSGHTTIAFFIAGLLSDHYPDYRQDFEMLAELIGQSRIENGVHFPTDVSAGKLIGEVIFDCYNNQDKIDVSHEKLKKSDSKKFGKFLQKNCDDVQKSISDLADYLHITNKIEQIHIPFSECHQASLKVHEGYPVGYVTTNQFLQSIIKPLLYAFKVQHLDSFYEILNLHKLMSSYVVMRGTPGTLRDYKHYSPSGHEYVSHHNIKSELENFCQNKSEDKFLRHALFEHIHPFPDGNGRIGRVILCSDLDYDFAKCNEIMNKNYIRNLNLYFEDLFE